MINNFLIILAVLLIITVSLKTNLKNRQENKNLKEENDDLKKIIACRDFIHDNIDELHDKYE